MKMKKFVHLFFLGVLCVILFMMGINYFTDTSGIFNKDFSKKRPEPNQHFVKVRYILSEPAKYNAFWFGSSRIGNIDVRKIKNDKRYYNMTYSEGLPKEWLMDIKLFLKHSVEIKQLILGLDEFSFRVDPTSHFSQLYRKPYKEENNLMTYVELLVRRPRLNPGQENKASFYDIYGAGETLHEYVDQDIEKNIEKHLKDKKFQQPQGFRGNRISQTIADLREIKNIAEENHIELIVFINPIHKTTYLDTNQDEFDEFKRELATITDYYDFSGLNEITTNNYNYYETSHYRPFVGDRILERILDEEKHNREETFGVYVTKNNVEQHIQKLRMDIEKDQ
ncbi:MAG: hypothetical protein H6Q69_3187 [Firmicutes bacterium]|nr:hypothetical protein [Bacillota bacterium]